MEEQPISNPKIQTTPANVRARTAGIISLVLIFFASLSFTWVLLAENADPTPVSVAAAAQAVPEPQKEEPRVLPKVDLQAKSAVVLDVTSGETLYEQNADAPLPLASLTKVPLTLVVAENLATDAIIAIPHDRPLYEGNEKFQGGEHWKVHDIVDLTLAASSNAGADILAKAVDEPIRGKYLGAPAENAAVWRMNKLVQHLGLTHTYFLNATGLDESPTQAGAFGSARDMGKLFAYAAETPKTFLATTKPTFTRYSLEGTPATAINTDEALPDIPGMILGKTGYTDLAGGNLAVVFEVRGHRISAAVLGSTQSGRFEDMRKLVSLTMDALTNDAE